MGKTVYYDDTGKITMTIYHKWYDPLCTLCAFPFVMFMYAHPLQNLMKFLRFIKFFTVGSFSALVALSILWVLTDVVGLHYMISNIGAIFVSTTIWFFGNMLWTFKDRKTTNWSVPKMLIVRTYAIVANVLLLALFVEVFGLWYLLSAAFIIFVVSITSYVLSNKWVWRHK